MDDNDNDNDGGSASGQDETDDNDGGLASGQDENMVDETYQPHTPVDEVDNALKILVRNATEEFGFAPRDVYNGVLDLPFARSEHTASVRNFSYSKLKSIVETFSMKHELDNFSSRVVAVYPLSFLPNDDMWGIDFKSIRIAREMMGKMRLEDDRHLREAFNFLYKKPHGSNFAGWYFEAIADRMLSSGWRSDGPSSQPIPMVSDCLVPPTFSMDTGSSPSRLPFVPLRAGTRVITPVDFACMNKLKELTLDGKNYYKPINTNNPLFDSFTIDREEETVMISIFHITISPKHGESLKDYLRIQEIMDRVHELLREASLNAAVKVTYFLVCPESGSQHKWKMSDGWKESISGDVFCVRVPTSARRGMLHLFVPTSAT